MQYRSSRRVIVWLAFCCLFSGCEGAEGPDGPIGVPSAEGPAGRAGLAGEPGSIGLEGEQGADGPPGQRGPEGPAGHTGPAGPKGTDGADGPAGLSGLPGPEGPPGTAAVDRGTVVGTVTNALTGEGLAGVSVTLDPPVAGVEVSTDSHGAFGTELPIGAYQATFVLRGFGLGSGVAMVAAGQVSTLHAGLNPLEPVSLHVEGEDAAQPGATIEVSAVAETFDGSDVTGYTWTQVSGVEATLEGSDTEIVTITLGDEAAYKAALIEKVEPPDRFMVLGINPYNLERTAQVDVEVIATTTAGTYTATFAVLSNLPWVVSTGVRNVPVDVPVMLHSRPQLVYDWSLTGPDTSAASLEDADTANPYFTPDAPGEYTLTEAESGTTMAVFAGTWQGAITGVGDDGLPLAAECTVCHESELVDPAIDKFGLWRASSHANIFTQNIDNPRGQWGTGCAVCHTVGYDAGANNDGFDDAMADEEWDVPYGHEGAYMTMFEDYNETAQRANIQCENCHGPGGGSGLHLNGVVGDAARVSQSSDLCASCHGEPLRYGRFQQWKLSGHSDYGLATTQATVDRLGPIAGHCGRCHSVQGFLRWSGQGDLTRWIQGSNGNALPPELAGIGLTAAEVHPVTCVACHDPHAQRSSSSEPSSATVRIDGDTPMLPAGFRAVGVGRGALCMMCHNTRSGAHDDYNPQTSLAAPHVSAQADVLMGENAFFVRPGVRSPHALIENTCTTCHMALEAPPESLSHNGGGTNHTFAASTEICGYCHGAFDGDGLQRSIDRQLEALERSLGEAATLVLQAAGTVQVRAFDPTRDVYSSRATNDLDLVLDIEANPVTSVRVTEGRGQLALYLELADAIEIEWADDSRTRTHDFAVQLRAFADEAGEPVFEPGDVLALAAWNYLLLRADDSHGVHNPGFYVDVVTATVRAVGAIVAESEP